MSEKVIDSSSAAVEIEAASPVNPWGARLKRLRSEAIRHAALLAAIAVVVVIGALGTDAFLTSTNMINILASMAAIGVVSLGMTILMASGGIDLSVGSAVGFISLLVAKSVNAGVGELLAILVGMGSGLGIGLIIGLVVVFTRAHPFMVTLGAFSIIAGLSLWMTNGQPVLLEEPFELLGVDKVIGIPVGFWVFFAVALLVYGFLFHLRAGRLTLAIGGSEEAARLAGVSVGRWKVVLYGLSGVLVGLGAAMIASRVGSGSGTNGTGLELQAIAAAVLGGATLAGGYGSVVGTSLAVLLLTLISTVLNLLGSGTYVANIVFGFFIIVAVGLAAHQQSGGLSSLKSLTKRLRAPGARRQTA